MSGVIAQLPVFQFNANGEPMVNGTLETYLTGTSTPASTWQDQGLTVLNTNPIVLNSRGEATIWLDSTKTYRFILKDSTGTVQWTKDGISGSLLSSNPSGASPADITYTVAAAGGVGRALQSKLFDTVSVKDFGAIGDGVANDTAAIQAAIDSLPLNTADTGVLSPKGFANGGTVYFPRGRYKVTSRIVLKRGLTIVGESPEASQVISFIGADSVFQYLDSGRYMPDFIGFENLSIWQDAGTLATAGAAIDVLEGPASVDAVNLSVRNVHIESTYIGLRVGAGIGCLVDNASATKCVAAGFRVVYTISTTSSTFKNCYASLTSAGPGFDIEGGAYLSFISCGSDSNFNYGYYARNLKGSAFVACGAEGNVSAASFVSCSGVVCSLFAISNTSHAVLVDNCNKFAFVGCHLEGAAGYGIHQVTVSTGIACLGVNFAGLHATQQSDTIFKYLDLSGDNALIGSGVSNNWALGGLTSPDTATLLTLGGTAGAATEAGLKVNYSFGFSGAVRNSSVYVQPTTQNTAVTYAILKGIFVTNANKGAASTITKSAGLYVQEQTQGASNANIMIDATASSVPAGNWSLYSDSTRDSVFKGRIRIGPNGGTAPFIFSGTGSPEGVVTAPVSSIFLRTDGGAATSFYVKETGAAATGWVAK